MLHPPRAFSHGLAESRRDAFQTGLAEATLGMPKRELPDWHAKYDGGTDSPELVNRAARHVAMRDVGFAAERIQTLRDDDPSFSDDGVAPGTQVGIRFYGHTNYASRRVGG